MAKIRVNRNKGYTVMSNYHLKDKSITLKSKGLLSMMLSLPDEWNYSTRGLAAICKEGVDAIGAALKELEKAGYIIRNQIRGERGRIIETEYVIYEQPQNQPPFETFDSDKPITPIDSGFSPHTGFPDMVNPDMDNPYTENPDVENPAQYNTKEITKNESSKKGLNTQSIYPGFTDTSPLPYANAPPQREEPMERTDEITAYRSLILENIKYDDLYEQYSKERIDEIVDIMLDAVCTRKPYLRVDGDEKPAVVVKNRLLKLDYSHIRYVFDRLEKNATQVHNMKAYLLTALYNAPVTLHHYYQSEVNHHLYGNPEN